MLYPHRGNTDNKIRPPGVFFFVIKKRVSPVVVHTPLLKIFRRVHTALTISKHIKAPEYVLNTSGPNGNEMVGAGKEVAAGFVGSAIPP